MIRNRFALLALGVTAVVTLLTPAKSEASTITWQSVGTITGSTGVTPINWIGRTLTFTFSFDTATSNLTAFSATVSGIGTGVWNGGGAKTILALNAVGARAIRSATQWAVRSRTLASWAASG